MTAEESDDHDRSGSDRRRFLKTAGAASLSVSLAGCELFGSDDDSTDEAGSTGDDSSTDDADDGDSTTESKEVVTREATASDVGLTADGVQDLGYPTNGAPPVTNTETLTYEGTEKSYEVTITESRFASDGVDFPVKMLASPSVEINGQERNPVLTLSLLDHVISSEGRFGVDWLEQSGLVSGNDLEVKSSTILAGAPESVYNPSNTSLLGNTLRYGSFQATEYGVIEVEVGPEFEQDPSTTVHVAVARATDSGDGVLVGVATGIPALSDSIPRERLAYVAEMAIDETTRNPPSSFPQPGTSLTDSRLVQTVADSRVINRNPVHVVDDPDLVAGQYTAPLFDIQGSSHPERLYCQLVTPGAESDEFGLLRDDIGDGALATIASQFNSYVQSDSTMDAPTPFRLSSVDAPANLSLEAPCGRELDSATMSDYGRQEIEPLRLGFIAVRDPNFGDNPVYGQATTYERTVDVAVQYLRRVYPGDIYVYRHDAPIRGNAAFGTGPDDVLRWLPFLGDAGEARNVLELLSGTITSSPADGRLWAYGGSRSDAATAIQNAGFNAWMLIVPDGYYDYHNQPDTAGRTAYVPRDDSLAPYNWYAATAREQAGNAGDRSTAELVAHELGHFFGGSDLYRTGPDDLPLAQRSNRGSNTTINGDPVDFAHARNPNSNHIDGGNRDNPGIASLAFDLTGGTFRYVTHYSMAPTSNGGMTVNDSDNSPDPPANRLESYMSYRDNRSLWSDARLHQWLLDADWSKATVREAVSFAARGAPAEPAQQDGPIQIDSTRVRRAAPIPETVSGSIQLSMRSPAGETLASRQVPETALVSEDDASVNHIDVRLPFPERAVEFRADRNGQSTRVNALVRPIRDAVDRVPDRGFRDDPEAARAEIAERLDLVDSLMRDRAYGEAAEERLPLVDELLTATIRENYDALANQPGREALQSLVGRMQERLQTLAESQ